MIFIKKCSTTIRSTEDLEIYFNGKGKNTYNFDDKITDIWDTLVNDDKTHTYDSFPDFIRKTTNFSGHSPLDSTLVNSNSYSGSRIKITMQGSRAGDYQEASRLTGLPVVVADYTWHHIEDFNPANNTCTMILVRTSVHQNPHYGAVHLWENYHNNIYS